MRLLSLEIRGLKSRKSASQIQEVLDQTRGLKGKVSYTDSRVHLMLTDEAALPGFITKIENLGYELSETKQSAANDNAPLLRLDKTMAIRSIPFLLLLFILMPNPVVLIPILFLGLYLIKHWGD